MGRSHDEFVKYPRTPHLFGSRRTDYDKHLGGADSLRFLTDGLLIVEEKLDGTNVGIHFHAHGKIALQCRGHLITEGTRPQHDLFKQWTVVKRPVRGSRSPDRDRGRCTSRSHHADHICFARRMAQIHTAARRDLDEGMMGKVYERLDDGLAKFLVRQHIFFVGTAPDAPKGHLNVSPSGLDTFRILGPNSAAYLDLTGSGIETVAHLRQNGRIAVMFCAFEGRPLILRLYGRGRVVEPGETEWDVLIARFPDHPGARTVVVVDVERIADSCRYAVPLYEFKGERSQLLDWAGKKGLEGLEESRALKNRTSIDGLTGLLSAEGTGR